MVRLHKGDDVDLLGDEKNVYSAEVELVVKRK